MRFRGPVGPKRQLTRPRGLPNYAEVVQDIAVCGLGCGLKKGADSAAADTVVSQNSVRNL